MIGKGKQYLNVAQRKYSPKFRSQQCIVFTHKEGTSWEDNADWLVTCVEPFVCKSSLDPIVINANQSTVRVLECFCPHNKAVLSPLSKPTCFLC